MEKIEVCIVCKNTISNDRRTLTEAKILTEAGLKVLVIGLLGEDQESYEERHGFGIRRVPVTLGLATSFKDFLYLPIYRRLSSNKQWKAQAIYRIITPWLRWLDRKLKRLTIYTRLSRTMLAEKADYYHVHFPVFLMFLTFLAAKLKRSRFMVDYNDILVLEQGIKGGSYYEQEVLWGRELSEQEQTRIDATIQLIPEGVISILDVGCGDGYLTNKLAGKYSRVVGLDISEEALRYVKTEKFRASTENLPFKDDSFALVLSTELVEHLPDDAYRKAIAEMKRVSKEWILIGVPWKEQLSIAQSRCIRCGAKFHVNYHHRSFNSSKLRKIFAPEFKLVAYQQVGGEKAYYVPWLLWIKRHLGGIWARTPTTICPNCGALLYPGGYPERNAVSKFCDERNERLKQNKQMDKSHIISLYRRTEGE